MPNSEEFDAEGMVNAVNDMCMGRIPREEVWSDSLLRDSWLPYDRITATLDKKDAFIEQIVSYLDRVGMARCSMPEAMRSIPSSIITYRAILVLGLEREHVSVLDQELVAKIAPVDVAEYANRRYREASNFLASMEIGTLEHRNALEKASFWSKMDRRIGLAVKLSFLK